MRIGCNLKLVNGDPWRAHVGCVTLAPNTWHDTLLFVVPKLLDVLQMQEP